MTEEEFLRRKEAADTLDEEAEANGSNENSNNSNNVKDSFIVDKAKRKPIGKEWGPNSFSSTFTCMFCNEQFRKDYRYMTFIMIHDLTNI